MSIVVRAMRDFMNFSFCRDRNPGVSRAAWRIARTLIRSSSRFVA